MKNSITVAQCRAARALLGWTQQELHQRSGVASKTIADFERGAREPYPRTLADLVRTLEDAGIEFIAENGGGVGVRLRRKAGSKEEESGQ